MRVAVLGSGSWGTALAITIARNGHPVTLVGRDPDEMDAIAERRENLRYLPGFAIPDLVAYATYPRLQPHDLVVIATPSAAVQQVLGDIDFPTKAVLASKGLEPGAARTLGEVLLERLPDTEWAVLSGPNLAVELVRGIPTASVLAARSPEFAADVGPRFASKSFRVYYSDDVVGVELAGALKNVLAIGAGMSDGLGFGDNTKGALLARGLREMARLGQAKGACVDTFYGIAGVGDLFATAASPLSRNYRVGKALGQGQDLEQALAAVGQVAEGVPTSESALRLAKAHNVETPIFQAVDDVIKRRISPLQAVSQLMERAPKWENELRDRSPHHP
jgi:glycerol-3-phosphate dehydrogenase (NAD(P)+)